MIAKAPQLLLENLGKIIDYSGRTIDSKSVYRVILGTVPNGTTLSQSRIVTV